MAIAAVAAIVFPRRESGPRQFIGAALIIGGIFLFAEADLDDLEDEGGPDE
ncbi:hypothetical protein AB0K09_12060 [Streptomyces sp. NPDC049577]|uniref:hypothetical protein n=1 Tax=Streptomyces sp. NPDC049577 TaxID=3155153 RepID=UPI00341BA8A1